MRNFLLAATVAAVAAFSSVAAKAVPVDPNGELSSSAAVGSAPDGVVGGTLGAGTTSFSNVPTAYTVIGTGPVGAGTYNLGAANGDAMALNVSTLDKTGTTLPLIISVTTATDVLTFTFSNQPLDWSFDAGVGSVPGSLHAVYIGTFSDTGGLYNGANASLIFTWSQVQAGGNITSSFILDTPSTVQTPEPASLALLGAGLASLGLVRRRRR